MWAVWSYVEQLPRSTSILRPLFNCHSSSFAELVEVAISWNCPGLSVLDIRHVGQGLMCSWSGLTVALFSRPSTICLNCQKQRLLVLRLVLGLPHHSGLHCILLESKLTSYCTEASELVGCYIALTWQILSKLALATGGHDHGFLIGWLAHQKKCIFDIQGVKCQPCPDLKVQQQP